MLAKCCQRRPAAILLHEPPQRGDVSAREDICRELRRIAQEYASAILFVSSDYDDFARICDRVLVFRSGTAVSELAGSSLTEERIVEKCYATAAAPAA